MTGKSMAALATFTCRPNSHPFQERQIVLNEIEKIGRSVARARPAPNNAIFDCKVLSRNHAQIWYENGKFYLQDTKSSNGTFVNNQRLSKGSEESMPHEIFSGDIIQFGVDVMENSRRVTHSCIIAIVQLYHPNGQEAVNNHSSPFLNTSLGVGTSQELYQLTQYLQEALHREQALQNKLATLQRVVESTQEASESGWQALIDEDRLLSRLEVLENQLQVYSKHQTEDSLRLELVALQEDKYNYETTAKESLRKVLEEKLEAIRTNKDLERSLDNVKEECDHQKSMCESAQDELQKLAEQHEEKIKEIADLQEKIQEAERLQEEETEKSNKDKMEIEARLDDALKHEAMLQAKIEALEADNDFTKEQLVNMSSKYESVREANGEPMDITDSVSQGIQVDLVTMLDLQMLQSKEFSDSEDEDMVEGSTVLDNKEKEESIETQLENSNFTEQELREKLLDTSKKLDHYKDLLQKSEQKLKLSRHQAEKLCKELNEIKGETSDYKDKISELEDKLSLSEKETNQKVEETIADLKAQLVESLKREEESKEIATDLNEQIQMLESRLPSRDSLSGNDTLVTSSMDITVHASPVLSAEDEARAQQLQKELASIKEQLEEALSTVKSTQAELDTCKCDLEASNISLLKSDEEVKQLRIKLKEAQSVLTNKEKKITDLQDKVSDADVSSRDVKQQIMVLQAELQKAQDNSKSSQREATLLKAELLSLQEELDSVGGGPLSSEIQKHVTSTRAEFVNLKEECFNLRQRVQDIENEMRVSRTENVRLQTDYSKLQESYLELELLKDRLENKLNLTDAQKQANNTMQQLSDSGCKIQELQAQCLKYEDEIRSLESQINNMEDDYDLLSYKTKTLSTVSMLPLLALVLGFLMAVYPILSALTATGEPGDPLPT